MYIGTTALENILALSYKVYSIILLLHVYPRETLEDGYRETYSKMISAPLFIITRYWKQPKGAITENRLRVV